MHRGAVSSLWRQSQVSFSPFICHLANQSHSMLSCSWILTTFPPRERLLMTAGDENDDYDTTAQRLPLWPAHLRKLQRLLQAHSAKQKGVLVRGRPQLPHRQAPEETVPLLSFPEVPRRGHEIGGRARRQDARRPQQVRAHVQARSRQKDADHAQHQWSIKPSAAP